jgi:hypothetical protein
MLINVTSSQYCRLPSPGRRIRPSTEYLLIRSSEDPQVLKANETQISKKVGVIILQPIHNSSEA